MLKTNGGITAVALFNMPGNAATKRLAISSPLRSLRVNANTGTRAARNIAFSWGLRRIAPDCAVLGQHHPASTPGLGQPAHVGRVLIEHLVVHDDCGARRAQRLDNELAVEASIDEEDDLLRGGGLTRQAATGSE